MRSNKSTVDPRLTFARACEGPWKYLRVHPSIWLLFADQPELSRKPDEMFLSAPRCR